MSEDMSLEHAGLLEDMVGRLISALASLTEKLEEVRKEQSVNTRQIADLQKKLVPKLASIAHSSGRVVRRY